MRSFRQILRGFFSIRRHLIMKKAINLSLSESGDSSLVLERIENFSDLIDGTYSVKVQTKIISQNWGKCDTFILKEREKTIGILSIMYKGGNELEYKIRDIEAFLYNVMIIPEYRGQGYFHKMLSKLEQQLVTFSIKNIYLAVSTDNESAIKAYEKNNFTVVDYKIFIRFLKKNLPYYVL